MRSKNRKILILVAVLALFGLLFAKGACKKRLVVQRPPKEVSVVTPERRTISKTVIVTGSVEAESFAEIYPRGPGKVLKKLLNEGDPVEKDQPIMTTLRDDVGYTFKPAPVVSKISGLIGRIYVDVGGTVDTTTRVATVVQPDRMRIKLDVPERYLPNISVGQKVDFESDTLPNEKFEGAITSISQAVDIKNRTSRVELAIPNEGHKLVHGMFARVDMPIVTHENVLNIPITAISWEADKQFVYKVVNGHVVHSQIELGIRNATQVEVLKGLADGEAIVADDLLDLKDGDPVK